MKTVKQAIKDAPNMEQLIKRVVKQIGGAENLEGLRSADDGYPGFTYYSDTHKFAMANRALILDLLNETADQLGEEVVSMVKNFGVFKGEMDHEDLQDLYKYLGGGRPEQGTVTNVMAWFALEEVARIFND
jgi:hypothetical protein